MKYAVHLASLTSGAMFCLIGVGIGRAGDPQPERSATVTPSDMQIRAEARWNNAMCDGQPQRFLGVSLIVQGGAAAGASAYGDLKIKSLRDEQGQFVKAFPMSSAMRDRPTEEKMLLVLRRDYGETHPKDGVRVSFDLQNPAAIKRLSELQGTFVLRTGGHKQVIALPDALKQTGRAIEDASLKDLGITVRLARKTSNPGEAKTETSTSQVDGVAVQTARVLSPATFADELDVKVAASKYPVVCLEITNANGKPITPTSSRIEFDSSVNSIKVTFKDRLPEDSQLRLTVHKDAKKVSVPFRLTDVGISSVEEWGELRGSPIVPSRSDGRGSSALTPDTIIHPDGAR